MKFTIAKYCAYFYYICILVFSLDGVGCVEEINWKSLK